MPSLTGATVLVTGANGGIGTQFVADALARGARKVYATARTPRTWEDARVVPLALDVTDPASIEAVVAAASDTTVLINNAGANPPTASLLDISEADLRQNMETNFFGPLAVARAFAPILAAAAVSRPDAGAAADAGSDADATTAAGSEGHAGPVLVDVHSVASWYAFGGVYSASKAALWSATNSLRLELAPRGVHVVGVHMGYVDTAMAAHADGPKLTPLELVQAVYAAVEQGAFEVIGDETTAGVKAALSAPVEALYPEVVATKA